MTIHVPLAEKPQQASNYCYKRDISAYLSALHASVLANGILTYQGWVTVSVVDILRYRNNEAGQNQVAYGRHNSCPPGHCLHLMWNYAWEAITCISFLNIPYVTQFIVWYRGNKVYLEKIKYPFDDFLCNNWRPISPINRYRWSVSVCNDNYQSCLMTNCSQDHLVRTHNPYSTTSGCSLLWNYLSPPVKQSIHVSCITVLCNAILHKSGRYQGPSLWSTTLFLEITFRKMKKSGIIRTVYYGLNQQ